MRLLIDEQEIAPSEYTGGDAISVDIQDSDENGDRITTVSQEFVLTGSAFDLINETFILDPEGKLNSLSVKIFETGCCEEDTLIFEGLLKGSNVDWCYGECSAKVTFVEFTNETELSDCVFSTLIDDNFNGFQSQNHPRVPYCIEIRPELLQHIILISGIILNLILVILIPIVAIVSEIFNFINFLIETWNSVPLLPDISWSADFDGNENTNFLQEYLNFRDNLNSRIIGCGRKHPSPYVREYILNVCNKCGLTFESSILNDPTSAYYKTMYLFAPVSKGTLDASNFYIFKNRPIKTLSMLLDDLKIPFNAKWKIQGTTLYFERRDFFDNGEPWVSYMTLEQNEWIDEKVCFKWRTEDSPSLVEFQHQIDPLDSITVEAKPIYDDIVEWNQPFSKLQSGIKTVTIPFAPSRFRDDGIEEDILGVYQNAPFIGGIIQQYNSLLILDKGIAGVPRLLVKDSTSPNNNAKVIRTASGGAYNYNFPYYFNEDGILPNTAYPTTLVNGSMYSRFWTIDNPKVLIDLGKEFEFSFRYNCELLQSIFNAEYVILPIGDGDEGSVGTIKRLTVNLSQKTISVQGTI